MFLGSFARTLGGVSLSAITLSFLPFAAYGQDRDGTDMLRTEATAGTTAFSGEQIVVAARRTVEDIQSVPVSVTAFSAETLRQSSIRDTQGFAGKDPGRVSGGVRRTPQYQLLHPRPIEGSGR